MEQKLNMENLSINYEDGEEVKKPSRNADSVVLTKSQIKATTEKAGYPESAKHNDKQSTDYLKCIHGEMDDLVVQLDELTQMLAKEQMVARTLSDEISTSTQEEYITKYKRQLIIKRLDIKSIETEIDKRSNRIKMLKNEIFQMNLQQRREPNSPQTKDEHSEQSQLQQSSQSVYGNDFCFQKFDLGYGIIIEGTFPNDFSCDIIPWTSDERLDMINDGVFPDGFRLKTDIFYVKDSKAAGPLNGRTIPADNISLKATLLNREPCENLNHQYKGAVRFNNAWKFHEPRKDKDIAFRVDAVESFCVISIVQEERYTILPSGGHFISPIDNRIQVRFPPNVVDKEERMSIMIHPINLNCLSEKIYQDTDNEEVCISAITHGLSSKHTKFNQYLDIQLPLHYLHGFHHEDDFVYKIFKWEDDDGSFEFVDIKPVIQNNIASFQVNSFSGYGCVSASKSMSISSLGSLIQKGYELRVWCKILFFVGKKTSNNLQIMLECVDLQRVSEVCANRKKYGYHFVSEWISRDFHLIPDKTIITIDVKGKFAIPKESNVKHPKLSFIPVAQDNFTRFPVEIKTSGAGYGVLSIRDNKGVLDEILYDPDSRRTTPLNKKIREELIGNRNDKLITSRISTAQNQKRNVEDFFTERGLLALSKSMSPDTMLDVCINMDMTTSTYATIRQKHGISTLGNIALWKTALDQQPHNKQLENLIKALIAAGQKALADKVQLLQSTGKDLHTI